MHSIYHWIAWTWGGAPFRSGEAGYNIFSGPLPDLVFVGALIHAYRKHICHARRCFRPAWHVDPAHGHPVCRRHHPLGRTDVCRRAAGETPT